MPTRATSRKALEYNRRVLAMYEEMGDHAGVARSIVNVGIVLRCHRRLPIALEHYRRAMATSKSKATAFRIAIATGNIGNTYNNTGDYSSALEYYSHAMVMYEHLGHRLGVDLVTRQPDRCADAR